jgi:hypothetical protein
MQRSAWRSVLRWVAILGFSAAIVVGFSAAIVVVLSVALRLHEPGATVGTPPNKPPPPSSDWPMYRHDPALTAVSPLRGGLAEAPQLEWSLDLGGPKVPAERGVVRDVTGDGQDEFLTLSADTVTCRDSRGRVLWTLAHFLNAKVVDVRDFVGHGSLGILLTTFLAGKLDTYMVCGRTGKASHLWRDENNFGGQTRIGQLLPGLVYDLENDGRFQILASIKNEHGDGNTHLVVFEARTGKATVPTTGWSVPRTSTASSASRTTRIWSAPSYSPTRCPDTGRRTRFRRWHRRAAMASPWSSTTTPTPWP